MIGVYKITNIINGKVYIGESLNIERRWDEHKLELENGTHHSFKLQNDYNEYGKNNFIFEVLKEIDEDKNMMLHKCLLYIFENKYIKSYDSINNGYNIEDSLDLILKCKKPIFEGDEINYKSISVLKSIIKNIDKNNGNFIIKEKPKPKPKVKFQLKEQYKNAENESNKNKIKKNINNILNNLYNNYNINFIINNCKNYIFKEDFERLYIVLKDNGFHQGKVYSYLREINILDDQNKCLINDNTLFNVEKRVYNNIDKVNIAYVTYVSQKGFIYLLNIILKYAKENNINMFTHRFIKDNLIE